MSILCDLKYKSRPFWNGERHTGCPQNKELLTGFSVHNKQAKSGAAGPNFLMDMTWGKLISLRLNKKTTGIRFEKKEERKGQGRLRGLRRSLFIHLIILGGQC